jgi:carbohydrate-binding DOMON domain-containing protein
MKQLFIASIVLAMAAPAYAQTQTPSPTQPQTRTTDGDSTMTETQKGGPASKESVPGAGGQQEVVKSNPGVPDATKVPNPPAPR